MKKNIKILICDDQDVDHTIIRKNFIEKTFFYNRADVDSIYYFETAPENKGTPLLNLLKEDFDFDIIFLDLNFIPEQIEEEEDEKDGVISKTLDRLKIVKRDVLLLILSKDGGNRSDNYTNQGVPIIDKNASQKVINKFLVLHFDRFVRSKIVGCTFNKIQSIREGALMGNQSIDVEGEEYITSSLFAHLLPKDYNNIFQEIPIYKEDAKLKFKLPLKDYFKEVIQNLAWKDEVKLWEDRLENLIISHLLSEYCNIPGGDDNYARVIENTLLVWDTSIVKDFNESKDAVPTFLKKLNTRRLIAFLYIVCNYDQKKIYFLLKGIKDDPGEKTISNGFRYSYFLYETSAIPEVKERMKTYHKVRNQLDTYDRKLLKKIGNTFLQKRSSMKCEFSGFNLNTFSKELNNLG